MKGHYKLDVTKWINGRLRKVTLKFKTYSETLAESHKHQGKIKIYNHHGELVHQEGYQHHHHDSYA